MKIYAVKTLMVVMLIFLSLSAQSALLKFKNETIEPKVAMNSFGFDQNPLKRFWPLGNSKIYVIQFNEPLFQNLKNKLEASGVELSSYIPDNAFIAKINSDSAWVYLNESKNISAVIPFTSGLRVSKNILVPSVFNKNPVKTVLVKIAFEGDYEPLTSSISKLGMELISEISSKVLIVRGDSDQIYKLAETDGVEWIEPYSEIHSMEFDVGFMEGSLQGWFRPKKAVVQNYSDLTGYESGTKLMGFDVAWELGYHGEGEVVGIADSGLDRGSADNILEDFKGQVVRGYAKGFLSNSWEDAVGHGTHTSGSIVGTGITSKGILKGGAYNAKLVVESMTSPVGDTLAGLNFDDLYTSVYKNDGVNIHSNSWGISENLGVYDNLASLIDQVMWNNPDLLLVFASGNSGADLDKDGHIDSMSIGSPGTAKNPLTVGASKNFVLKGGKQNTMIQSKDGAKKWGAEPLSSSKLSDNPKGMAAFSSIGPTKDGRIKPDVVAPGTNILSTRSQVKNASVLWGAYNDTYIYGGGTSMATPLTAGAAAITRQYLKSKMASGVVPSAALIKAAIIHTSKDLFPGQFGTGVKKEFSTIRPNMNEGYGRVDLEEVVKSPYYFSDEKEGLSSNQLKEFTLGLDKVVVGQKIKVTLVYTDAPASSSAAEALVNDLDVSVMDKFGKTYFPNHLNAPDNINNVEMIEFEAKVPGVYKIFVKASRVAQGKGPKGLQPFALLWNYR